MLNISVDFPFALSPEAAKTQADLRADIGDHNATCQDLENQVQALSAADWSSDREAKATRLRKLQVDALNREAALLATLRGFYATVAEAEQPAAIQQAYLAFQATQADILQKLIDIGYVDGPIPGTEGTPCIMPDMILRHPSVHAARSVHASLQAFDMVPQRQLIEAATARTVSRLDSMRALAMRGLSA